MLAAVSESSPAVRPWRGTGWRRHEVRLSAL